MHFHIAHTTTALRTTSFRTHVVPMNNLENMKNCPKVQGNLNWMLGYWGGVKSSKHFLLKAVRLQTKSKGTEYIAIFKLIFSPYTHPQPKDGVNGSKHFFSESSHVAYQIGKGN